MYFICIKWIFCKKLLFLIHQYIQSAEQTHLLLTRFICSISGFHLFSSWRSGCSSEIKLWRLRRALSSQAWTRTSRTKGCQSPVSKTPWCLTAAVRRTMGPCRSRTASRSTGSAAFQHCISVCLCACVISPAVKSRLRPSQRLSLLEYVLSLNKTKLVIPPCR